MLKNVLMIGMISLGLVACGSKSTTTETAAPAAAIDCSKLDANAADYPEVCKAAPEVTPPAPTKCQNDPCEGDPQPAK